MSKPPRPRKTWQGIREIRFLCLVEGRVEAGSNLRTSVKEWVWVTKAREPGKSLDDLRKEVCLQARRYILYRVAARNGLERGAVYWQKHGRLPKVCVRIAREREVILNEEELRKHSPQLPLEF